jgi:hypothetical protein
MFSLDIPTEPYWIDLPMGVRVKVRPVDGITVAAARTFAFTCATEARKQREERLDAGLPVDDLLDLDDMNIRDGFVKVQLAAALARYGAVDWEGVGTPEGEALPFSKAGAEQMARHPVMTQPFLDACFDPSIRVVVEGNASAPGLNGSTVAGAVIARAAETSATSAPAS